MSRYIASFYLVGGDFYEDMRSWLQDLEIGGEKLTEEEIWHIYHMATCGKYELQCNARDWLKSKKQV